MYIKIDWLIDYAHYVTIIIFDVHYIKVIVNYFYLIYFVNYKLCNENNN